MNYVKKIRVALFDPIRVFDPTKSNLKISDLKTYSYDRLILMLLGKWFPLNICFIDLLRFS